MPMIQVNDANFYYELHGEGQPLVLIAGYTCDHTFWSLMLDELAKKFQVLIFDNRGVGQTKDNGKPFTIIDMSNDVIALIDALDLKKPHIVGQSMGGGIAQLIALHQSSEIKKLILLNSTFKINMRAMLALSNFLELRKKNLSIDLQIDIGILWFFSSEFLTDPKNIKIFRDSVINNPYPQTLSDQERQLAALQAFDSVEYLHKIVNPTFVIAGVDDIVTPAYESEVLANNIPNAKYKGIPGGHSSPLERAEDVNHLIFEFLE